MCHPGRSAVIGEGDEKECECEGHVERSPQSAQLTFSTSTMGTPDIAQDPFATTATRSYEGVYTAATTVSAGSQWRGVAASPGSLYGREDGCGGG